ncbi:MAG: CaiB/BaiF CoA-transferase family protein [Pseudomonadota bacterium]
MTPAKKNPSSGMLAGIQVLDITHVLAGPFASYQLALMGADVLKIEPPDQPDCARGRGPDSKQNARGLGLNYQVQGGNKRALSLDLAHPRGKQIFLRLAQRADVMIENFTTGTMARLGLDYPSVCTVNKDIIYCSITGFGHSGDRAHTGAYDNVIQAASGIIDLCGGHKPGLSFVDYATGYAAAFAIVSALVGRAHTGKGTHISTSMLEVAMQMAAPEIATTQHPQKTSHGKEIGISAYETAKGRLMLGVFHPGQYRKLAHLLAQLGQPIPAFASIQDWPDVWALDEDIRTQLAQIMRMKTADEWVSLLHDADLPAEKITAAKTAGQSPQLRARGYFSKNPADQAATLPLLASRFSHFQPAINEPPPIHGAHTRQVLDELGLSAQEIETLENEKVISCPF